MTLRQLQLKSAQYLMCDWVEIRTLATELGEFRLGGLKRLWDVSRESESSDIEGREERESDTDLEGVSGSDEDVFLDSITDEFGDRAEALGENYPFRLDSRSLKLRVIEPQSIGGYVYLFCLLLAHASSSEIFDGSWAPQVDGKVRDLFQVGATLAAAGEVRGCAISFGWPRPYDNPPFLEKLRQVYELFGEGRVVAVARPGVSPFVKDEEIDVIAWRPQRDRAPGTDYLLGQVASGDNWMSKPIAGKPIENFHRNWFQPPPPSQARASIFIPHAVPPHDGGTRRERLDAITVRYGVVIDRMRLPALANDGMVLALDAAQRLSIERAEEAKHIAAWVNTQTTDLRSKSTIST